MRHKTLALLLCAAPALAQDRPPIMPTRDVAVTYRVGGGQPGEMQMSWLTAQGLMRMDMPGGQGFMVVNVQAGSGFMVMPSMRMVMDMPAGAGGVNNFARASQTARFTREGSDRVANTPCTLWRVEDRGDTARVCTTADGVTLRATPAGGGPGDNSPQGGTGGSPGSSPGGIQGAMEAIRVEYGTQDATRFARPQGYQTMQMPGAGAAAPAPAPAAGGNFPNRGSALPPPGVAR